MRVLILMLGGCAGIFDLERVEPVDGSTTVPDADAPDARPVEERPAFCANAALFDGFDTEDVCPYASRYGESLLVQTGGVLEIRHTGELAINAGCTVFQGFPFTNNGVFLRVLEPLRVASGYTQLHVRHDISTTGSFSARILFDGSLKFLVDGVLSAQRFDVPEWWRIRVDADSNVLAEVSADGVAWEEWAIAQVMPPVSINVDFAAGMTDTPGTAATAKFAAFGICN